MQPKPHPFAQRCGTMGFSMVEVLFCVALLGILASLAAPSFRTALTQQRIAGVRAELLTAMQLARVEALRRNTTVTLLRRADCSTPLLESDDWHCGWHLVAGARNGGAAAVEDAEILQTFSIPNGLRLVHPGGGQGLQIARSGYPVLVAHKFIIGPPADGRERMATTHHTTTLCVNRTGRVRTVEGRTTC